jgi:rfaE bifunctional protein kinase chain/domain
MKPFNLNRFEEITSSFKKINPIFIIGDVGLDKYTQGTVSRISPEAPVPVIEVTKEWIKLGLAANVSHNLSTLEIPSSLCSVIGDDKNGRELESQLEEIGQKTWGLVQDGARPTTYKERVTTSVQQICRIDYERVDLIDSSVKEKIKVRIKELMKGHSIVVIQDYAKGLFDEDLLQFVISEAKRLSLKVCVDPGKQTPPHFYRGANLIKPNFSEAKIIAQSYGERSSAPEKLCAVIRDKLQIETVIMTLGPEGMAILDQQGFRLVPTISTEVYDVSGAGDTAISVMAASLAAGANLEEAAWLANSASGVVIGKKGTATLTLSELQEFYQRLHSRLNSV